MFNNLVDIEKAVLGCMLLDPIAIADASSGLNWSDFSLTSHQVIFQQIMHMGELGEEVNTLTLISGLKPSELKDVGGPAYIADLPTGIPRGFSVAEYVKIVATRSLARRAI
jgi:replicative DNA helicase